MKLLMLRFGVGLALILGLANPVQAQRMISPGTVSSTFSAHAASTGTGTVFALPAVSLQCSWTLSFAGAPASVTVSIEGSLNNSDYFVVDTSTSTTGELRTFYTAARFIRGNISDISGGSGVTASINCNVINASTLYGRDGIFTGNQTFQGNVLTNGELDVNVAGVGEVICFVDPADSGIDYYHWCFYSSATGTLNLLTKGDDSIGAKIDGTVTHVLNWLFNDGSDSLTMKSNTFSASGSVIAPFLKTTTATIDVGVGSTAVIGKLAVTGPATPAQNGWLLMKDSTGTSVWVPTWK